MSEHSGFTSQGYEAMPSLTNDNEYTIHKLAEATPERLRQLREQYMIFISSDPLPHHRTQAERFLLHIDFEEQYRAGTLQ